MYRIVYLSRTPERWSDARLDEILFAAQALVEKRDITGLLLYARQTFLHVLEGPRPQVETVFDEIYHDPRHERIRIFQQRDVRARRFRSFSMGYSRRNGGPAPKCFFELTRSALRDRIPAEAAEELRIILRSFGETKLEPAFSAQHEARAV